MAQFSPLMPRRRALWLMGGLAGSLALHACQSSPKSTDTGNQKAGVKTGGVLWLGFLPLYVALEKGFFQAEGLTLDYNVFNSSTASQVAYGAKKLNALSNVTSEAVSLLAKDVDYRIIQVADTSLGGDGILARNSIADIADFKGKNIAVELNGVSHFFLLQVLQEAGLSADEIKITSLEPAAAATAYQAGRVEIAVTYSPFLKQANDAQKDGRIIYDTSKMPTAILDVYMFDPNFIAQHPESVQTFVNGIFKGLEFIETNKDEAMEIGAKRLELKPEELADELQGVDLTSPEKNLEILANADSDLYLVPHMQKLGQFLQGQAQIAQAPSTERLTQILDPTFVQAYR